MIEQSTIDLNSSDLVHGAQRENAVLGSVEGPGGTFHTTSVALPLCPCCRQPWLSAPKIQLSLDTYCAVINGAVIQLSPHEADIFAALLKYSPGTATVGALVRHVWGNQASPARFLPTLKVHLSHMRRKLAGSGFFIHSVWGLGYQLNDWEEPE